MEISGALNQYMNICRDAFNGYTAKLNKSTKYVVMETLLLFMVIPRKINFTQLARYGNRCEQCYRQTFSRKFDWVQYNLNLMEKLFGKNDRKAIAIDPSYISKSGKHTPNIGYFWSGVAGAAKRGLEILGIGIIDIDIKDCINKIPNRILLPWCETIHRIISLTGKGRKKTWLRIQCFIYRYQCSKDNDETIQCPVFCWVTQVSDF